MQIVNISDPYDLSREERSDIAEQIRQQNFALYKFDEPEVKLVKAKAAIRAFGKQLGLINLDAHLCADDDVITPLAVAQAKGRENYIPYSDKPISWHTDGYYNSPAKTIRAVILHCLQPAATGGANQVLDHEVMYSWLKAKDPEYIKVLEQKDVMTIPENRIGGSLVRTAVSSPVFSSDTNGNLYMRYTERKRNISWKNQPLVLEALSYLTKLLHEPSAHIHKVRLESGQGIVCNNVLHNREGFVNDADNERIMLRARYYDRINNA